MRDREMMGGGGRSVFVCACVSALCPRSGPYVYVPVSLSKKKNKELLLLDPSVVQPLSRLSLTLPLTPLPARSHAYIPTARGCVVKSNADCVIMGNSERSGRKV